MNGVKIVSDRHDLKSFIEFPYQHYQNDEHWIPPLKLDQKKLVDKKKNPFFNTADRALFLAEKNGKTVGRIAAIDDRKFNDYNEGNFGFFGFFECVNDQSVANLLFKVAADWLRDRGRSTVMGPTNPGMMDTVGILVEGFEFDPGIMMPYNKDYYDELIMNAGFAKAMDLLAFRVTDETVSLDRIERAETIVRRRLPSLVIRKVNLKNFNEEVETVRTIFNQAWAKNWGFSPMTKEEFEHLAKDLKTIVDTDFAHVAEVDGQPVAFSIALPDFNQALKHTDGTLLPFGILKLLYYGRKINQIRTALMGVIPEYQGKGIDALLHKEAIQNGLSRNFRKSELSWVLESNVDMIRVAERIGGTVEKRYRMYKQELS
ncbi:MAG TPA: GNAT family N-acetyltransferase [Balneolales bacterium]|nr:GNAT family N-acetyltransferase [Balneolales bacterium]